MTHHCRSQVLYHESCEQQNLSMSGSASLSSKGVGTHSGFGAIGIRDLIANYEDPKIVDSAAHFPFP